jgi:hypothetical protein
MVARALMSSFSDVYELDSKAVVKAAVLSAGEPENVPLNPEAEDSMVAMNCVLSVDEDRNVTAGSVMYPCPLTPAASAAKASMAEKDVVEATIVEESTDTRRSCCWWSKARKLGCEESSDASLIGRRAVQRRWPAQRCV